MTSSPQKNRHSDLDLIEIKPGKKFSLGVLQDLLPDVKSILFFGKCYHLDFVQLSALMHRLIKTDLADALFAGDHSVTLQDYLVDEVMATAPEDIVEGDVTYDPDIPDGEILPEMWEAMEIVVAASIQTVAEKLAGVIGLLPGKQGHLAFSSMMKLNRQRPTLGAYTGQVKHAHQAKNLLVLDVSGSMTESTIRRIIEDVVALAWKADAALAIVSNDTTYWEPGSYSVDEVLRRATYGGTHYETLAPLFELQDWGTVVTVADYDSSQDAKRYLRENCNGRITQLLDFSLVNRPTYLAECLGQLADEVRPMLIGRSSQVLA